MFALANRPQKIRMVVVPKRRDFCARSIRTVSYLSPCGTPRAAADGSLQHSVPATSLAEKHPAARHSLSNNSTETLQPHCLFRYQRSKLKRLASGPIRRQNCDVLTDRTTTSYAAFFRIAIGLLRNSCAARSNRAGQKRV